MSNEKRLCPLLAMSSLSGVVGKIIDRIFECEEDPKEVISSIAEDIREILDKIAYCRENKCVFFDERNGTCAIAYFIPRLSELIDCRGGLPVVLCQDQPLQVEVSRPEII